jgi:hypothetical protein
MDRAPDNKRIASELNFTEQQLNFVCRMMRQCVVLRQSQPILNLFRASIPDEFQVDFIEKESENGKKYLETFVTKKTEKTENEVIQN